MRVNSYVDGLDAETIKNVSVALASKTQQEIGNSVSIVKMALLHARISNDHAKSIALQSRLDYFIGIRIKRLRTITVLINLANAMQRDVT
jgi:hypothetical protein